MSWEPEQPDRQVKIQKTLSLGSNENPQEYYPSKVKTWRMSQTSRLNRLMKRQQAVTRKSPTAVLHAQLLGPSYCFRRLLHNFLRQLLFFTNPWSPHNHWLKGRSNIHRNHAALCHASFITVLGGKWVIDACREQQEGDASKCCLTVLLQSSPPQDLESHCLFLNPSQPQYNSKRTVIHDLN